MNRVSIAPDISSRSEVNGEAAKASTSTKSLNRQVLVPLALICLTVALALAAATQAIASRQAANESNARLQKVANALAETAFPVSEPVLEMLNRLSGLELIVCDSRSNVRGATTNIKPDAEEVIASLHLPSTDSRGSTSHTSLNSKTSAAEYASEELTVGGQAYRSTTVARAATNDSLLILLEPQAERKRIQQQFALLPLLTGLATLTCVAAVTLFVSQRLVRRIGSLQSQVHEIAVGKAERIVSHGPRDELSALADSVNAMADELRKVWRTIRDTERTRLLSQVASGLAHQLRNALTGIHLAVQLHRRDCPQANQESLAVAEAELARTRQVIQQLLHSAAGNTQQVQSAKLNEILNESESLMDAIALHRNIRLTWYAEGDIENWIVPDRELLRSAVVNLVINAMDAAGPEGDVQVHTKVEQQLATISVSDSGPGPSLELSDHLFDPFVTSKPEGLGVGLTVVRSAAEAFHGKVSWVRLDNRTIFRLEMGQNERNDPA